MIINLCKECANFSAEMVCKLGKPWVEIMSISENGTNEDIDLDEDALFWCPTFEKVSTDENT